MSKKVREAYERGYANGVREAAFQYLVTDREQQEREDRAFAAGVQAARDAVAALDYPHLGGSVIVQLDEALAAIDSLKEN